MEAGKSSCAIDEVSMLARRFPRWFAERRICSESRSLSRILARKGGVREIRYLQQNWFTCGSASGRGLFPRLGSLWQTGLDQRSTSDGGHVGEQPAFLLFMW